MKRATRLMVMAVLMVGLWVVDSLQAQWNSAQLLNEPTETGHNIKSGRVVGSSLGGFHAAYVNSSTGKLRYRRYDGLLHAPVNLFATGTFNPEIAESLAGEVHVVFEDWSGNGPEVGWVRSSDGGATFIPRQVLSSAGGDAKHPWIAPVGMGGSARVVMSYYNTGNDDLMYDVFDGLSWAGEWFVGAEGNSEYEVMGIGWSPLDGSVYRTFDNGSWLAMRRFDGANWSGDILLDSADHNGDGMHNRQRVAVNDAGQVMVIWDQGNTYFSMLYTPGVGPGPKTTLSTQASWDKGLCAIPGTNDFYAVYPRNIGGQDARRIVGRRFTTGAWQAEEDVMIGLPDEFCVDPRVSADPNGSGTLYCVFEYWGSGRPQQYYTIRPGSGGGPTGTVSGVVRDQYGLGLAGAIVMLPGAGSALSGPGGAYTLTAPDGTYEGTANKAYYDGHTVADIQVVADQTTLVDFVITGQPPSPVASITVAEGNTTNRVDWQNSPSGNASGTLIRYSTVAPPVGPTDGHLLLDESGAPGSQHSYNHTGLTNGVRVYYTAFAYFQDASRHYAAGLSGSGVPAVQADYDHDGDVDQEDFAHFQICLSGNNVAQDLQACQDAKFDTDDDVDDQDFGVFRDCMGGADVYADPQCAGLP